MPIVVPPGELHTAHAAFLARSRDSMSVGLKKRANLMKSAGHPQISSPTETSPS
jgi:hypothetical protein